MARLTVLRVHDLDSQPAHWKSPQKHTCSRFLHYPANMVQDRSKEQSAFGTQDSWAFISMHKRRGLQITI